MNFRISSMLMRYDPEKFPNRNDVYGFAMRTRKNLENINIAYSRGADVHPVTQVVCSLMGIAVFPWENSFKFINDDLSVTDIFTNPPLHFEIQKGSVRNFGELLRIVRNSVSHRGIEFSSDSRNLNEVKITLTERKRSGRDWEVRSVIVFTGTQLLQLCDGILNYICRSTG